MIGWKAPVGMIGLGFNYEMVPHVRPAVALGIGGPEGMHLSLGCETELFSIRDLDVGAFAYWSYVSGSRDVTDNTRSTEVTSGGALKIGGSLRFDLAEFTIVIGGGCAWFVNMPLYEEKSPNASFTLPADQYDSYFDPGLLVRLGIAFP